MQYLYCIVTSLLPCFFFKKTYSNCIIQNLQILKKGEEFHSFLTISFFPLSGNQTHSRCVSPVIDGEGAEKMFDQDREEGDLMEGSDAAISSLSKNKR